MLTVMNGIARSFGASAIRSVRGSEEDGGEHDRPADA